MCIILSIETSTRVCSIAIHQNQELIASSNLFQEKSHSSKLSTLIDQLLKNSEITYKDLSAVAVSKGPGSYTGLRIGISTAKGLCFTIGIPLISIDTLEALAKSQLNHFKDDSLLCPMIDARRMEVYCAVFNRELNYIIPSKPKIIDENSFSEILQENKLLFFGNGSEKIKDIISSENAIWIDNVNPSADSIGELAVIKYNKKSFEDLSYFEPAYLKNYKTITK